ncbi:hypothetical protein SKAU_G00296660 [Synaphobranchus kaupii]|uniref:Uncharacterized protein n=1 Tax=Synaphobranchus kaupii TaxID=118154 RepID=A0A9Q1EUV9_SYNKA|nr:hypothetical protein SKAU_G00296660 [Synaphobranchus kaupii]
MPPRLAVATWGAPPSPADSAWPNGHHPGNRPACQASAPLHSKWLLRAGRGGAADDEVSSWIELTCERTSGVPLASQKRASEQRPFNHGRGLRPEKGHLWHRIKARLTGSVESLRFSSQREEDLEAKENRTTSVTETARFSASVRVLLDGSARHRPL